MSQSVTLSVYQISNPTTTQNSETVLSISLAHYSVFSRSIYRVLILIIDRLKHRFYRFSCPSLRYIFNQPNLFCYTLYLQGSHYKIYWIWHLVAANRHYIWGAVIFSPLPIKRSYIGQRNALEELCFEERDSTILRNIGSCLRKKTWRYSVRK